MKTPKKEEKKSGPEEKKPLNNYIKYSTAGFQMAAIIGLGAWLGIWLDGRSAGDFPLYTIICSLVAIFAALYLTLRELIKKKD